MVFSSQVASSLSDGTFYQAVGSAFYASEDKLAGDYSPVRYTREIRLLRKFCSSGRVLDVGCSTGGFLYYLRQSFPKDYDICGTDVASGALDHAVTKNIPVLRENFLSDDFPRREFDAITFWAVLEHVAEPAAFLRRAFMLLKPGGLGFVLVPNIESLATRILGAKYRYILPQHLNYFSRATLRRLAESSGFSVLHSTTTHFNPVVILQDFRSRGRAVADADRAKLLVRTNRLKTNPLLLPARYVYRLTENILAPPGLADNVVLVLRK